MSCYNRKKIYKRTSGRCFYCGSELNFNDFHIDHIVPKSKGGTDSPYNLAATCPICNLSKHNKYVEEFREYTQDCLYSNTIGKLLHRYYKMDNPSNLKVKFYFEYLEGDNSDYEEYQESC